VIASLFTALILTRQIFDFLLLGRSLKHLSIWFTEAKRRSTRIRNRQTTPVLVFYS